MGLHLDLTRKSLEALGPPWLPGDRPWYLHMVFLVEAWGSTRHIWDRATSYAHFVSAKPRHSRSRLLCAHVWVLPALVDRVSQDYQLKPGALPKAAEPATFDLSTLYGICPLRRGKVQRGGPRYTTAGWALFPLRQAAAVQGARICLEILKASSSCRSQRGPLVVPRGLRVPTMAALLDSGMRRLPADIEEAQEHTSCGVEGVPW